MEDRIDDANVQRIRDRAYALWEQEGRPSGQAERHWTQAVAEIAAQDAYGLDAGTVRKMRKSARAKPKPPSALSQA